MWDVGGVAELSGPSVSRMSPAFRSQGQGPGGCWPSASNEKVPKLGVEAKNGGLCDLCIGNLKQWVVSDSWCPDEPGIRKSPSLPRDSSGG